MDECVTKLGEVQNSKTFSTEIDVPMNHLCFHVWHLKKSVNTSKTFVWIFFFVWVDVVCDVLSSVFGLSDTSSISILIFGKHSFYRRISLLRNPEMEADGSSLRTERSEIS